MAEQEVREEQRIVIKRALKEALDEARSVRESLEHSKADLKRRVDETRRIARAS